MKKRILPILLALIMALTLLPTLAMADEPANKVLIAGNNQVFTTLEAAVKEAEAGEHHLCRRFHDRDCRGRH